MTNYYPIIKRNALKKDMQLVVAISENLTLLFIVSDGDCSLVENKCGHFGVPLDTGRVENNRIVCAEHGIAFCLKTGENVNRPWENCDPIKTYQISESETELGVWI
jgi:nitrite reductase/ring-hydroxylating ferredoxin subunit